MHTSPKKQVTARWLHTLRTPPEWTFSGQGHPAMWDKKTRLGMQYRKEEKKWATGFVAEDGEFLITGGPFDTAADAAISLIAAVAAHYASTAPL